MSDALLRIRPLAKTLGQAALRVLIELACRASEAPHFTSCSSRELAEATGISRRHVQSALDVLEHRGLLQTKAGTAVRSSGYRLVFLEVTVLSGGGSLPTPPVLQGGLFTTPPVLEGGVLTTPPVPENEYGGGSLPTPPLATLRRQGGVLTTPPPNEESVPYEPRTRERAHAPGSIDSDSNFVAVIDRLVKTKISDYDSEQIVATRDWLHGYMCKFGVEKHAHPPDDITVARFLSIANRSRLEALLYDLMAETPRRCGDTYAWFHTVALQRIHGISPDVQRQIRADLRLVKKPRPAPAEQQPLIEDDAVQQVEELKRSLRAAAGKGMR